jgi:sterol desaturase/sphingolipid hydroxylase (fatty acid hydroxylase superfamily)
VPTLIELFTDPISLAFFGLFAALWIVEARFPARALTPIRGHRWRGVASLVAYFLVSSYLPLLIAPWFEPLRLFDLSSLGAWGGGIAAYLVYQVFAYAYHRTIHRFDGLFRAVHQLHHSAERLDVASAFLFSPLDMIGWTLVSTVALSLVGITPSATVVFLLFGTFLSTFQHANLNTPQWLGYVVQRPESHSHHHARGVHAKNYADLPIFDVLFGTFVNPRDFAANTGYYDGASARVGDMLRCRDVTRPRISGAAKLRRRLPLSANGATEGAEPSAVLDRG